MKMNSIEQPTNTILLKNLKLNSWKLNDDVTSLLASQSPAPQNIIDPHQIARNSPQIFNSNCNNNAAQNMYQIANATPSCSRLSVTSTISNDSSNVSKKFEEQIKILEKQARFLHMDGQNLMQNEAQMLSMSQQHPNIQHQQQQNVITTAMPMNSVEPFQTQMNYNPFRNPTDIKDEEIYFEKIKY